MESAREQLEGPPIPPELAHVWGWFVELSRGRSFGFSANPLAWSDIEAWALMTRIFPTPLELHIIFDLDAALLATLKPEPK